MRSLGPQSALVLGDQAERWQRRVGKSGKPAAQIDQQLASREIRSLTLPKEREVDNLGGVVLSVLRDMAIAGLYGFKAEDGVSGAAYPTLNEVFVPEYAERIEAVVGELESVHGFGYPVYTGIGDLVGYLARLLIFVRESSELKPYLQSANNQISTVGLVVEYTNDSDYLRHLRNSIAHARFAVLVDPENPFESKLVFLDLAGGDKKVTAKITATADQLMSVIRIVIHEVYEVFLSDAGWIVE